MYACNIFTADINNITIFFLAFFIVMIIDNRMLLTQVFCFDTHLIALLQFYFVLLTFVQNAPAFRNCVSRGYS